MLSTDGLTALEQNSFPAQPKRAVEEFIASKKESGVTIDEGGVGPGRSRRWFLRRFADASLLGAVTYGVGAAYFALKDPRGDTAREEGEGPKPSPTAEEDQKIADQSKKHQFHATMCILGMMMGTSGGLKMHQEVALEERCSEIVLSLGREVAERIGVEIPQEQQQRR